jgi:hypothetical protein
MTADSQRYYYITNSEDTEALEDLELNGRTYSLEVRNRTMTCTLEEE